MSYGSEERPRLIKCVVWDLDNTLWAGTAVEGEADTLPPADPRILDIISTLEKRGIASSVSSRNDPLLLQQINGHPDLSGLFVVPQVSWGPKSQAVRKVAETLNIGIDSLAFVDDSPFERAEVAYMLPDVLVLAPEDLDAALSSPEFNPLAGTAEAATRVRKYREESSRRAAEAEFSGSRLEFLKSCEMRLFIGEATEEDLPRIVEMTERTHQLNSTGRRHLPDEVRAFVQDPRWLVPVARLEDHFGDYGLIGAAIVDRQVSGSPDVWLAELVMLSCRVEGRGIPAALLTWMMSEASSAGMRALRAFYRANKQNLPIRLLFRQLGFLTAGGTDPVVVERDLSSPLPEYPEWLSVHSARRTAVS